ncbi:MAG TPA: methionine adenosyltransferase [Perlabentimonas sp.]|nr:methionine adenosyltransferase [Bacteroidales bacterium]MDD4673194.1 methionine adenosyltransferase [Bacteroidales bacterium]MDY0349230.1 methionine adenosyltransferase [Tenuifilaceae bacterium]HZJ73206.1 methionine adenosyltransferase [Perlabentimonas sp.]
MGYLFTSESVSEGHPDKVADQISDAILDEFLRQDPNSKVACETLVTTGLVMVSGEVKSKAYVDFQQVARGVVRDIGYTKSEYMFDADSCGVITTIQEQSPDINRGVERQSEDDQGAGDQGMMFGYACRETDDYMPLAISISHILLMELAKIRSEGKEMTYLRPDAKSQVTIEYNDNGTPKRVHTIVVSTQHDEFDTDDNMHQAIKRDVSNILIPKAIARLPKRVKPLFDDDFILHVNPTGKFVIGGPHGDTGLTGRKIIVDTYGGKGAHGGGAFSGKDSSKVDRSAAYAARHIAKNLVAAGVANEVLVQLAYAIGVARPVSVYVNTYGTAQVNLTDVQIAKRIIELFDLRPNAIIKRFGLTNPIFRETAAYGHFGRDYYKKTIKMNSGNGTPEHTKEVEFFAWEKLDYVDKIKSDFKL